MVEVNSLDDVPTRVLEVLKIFLAASSRGEKACLVLETKCNMIITKYRSVDMGAGTPAAATNITTRRRKTPARARRSQLRLEEFTRKKLEEKAELETQQASVNDVNRLVVELPNKKEHTSTEQGAS